jgi:hypothetical protein
MRATENSVTQMNRMSSPIYVVDGFFRSFYSIWMTEFSVTLMFWSSVTLGFSNSVWSMETLAVGNVSD